MKERRNSTKQTLIEDTVDKKMPEWKFSAEEIIETYSTQLSELRTSVPASITARNKNRECRNAWLAHFASSCIFEMGEAKIDFRKEKRDSLALCP